MTYSRQLIYRLDFLVLFTEMIHFVHFILKFKLYKNLLHSSVQNFLFAQKLSSVLHSV